MNTFHVTEGRVKNVHRERIDDDLSIVNALLLRSWWPEDVVQPFTGQRLESRDEEIYVDFGEGIDDAVHMALGQNGVGQLNEGVRLGGRGR